MRDIYEVCPIYKSDNIILRLTGMEDAEELLKCYSDEKSVPLFNSDNCNGDDFNYKTIERMRKAIEFWKFSYNEKYFIRFTIIMRDTGIKIGTVEMFRREAQDELHGYGVLRIDLKSEFEREDIIVELMGIVKKEFYQDFGVDKIITKVVEGAGLRRNILREVGYRPFCHESFVYDDYFIK